MSATRRIVTVIALVSVCSSTLVLAGCVAANSSSEYALTSLAWQAHNSNGIKLFRPDRLSNALPNVRYQLPSGEELRVSTVTVRGEFRSWKRGTATNWAAREDDSPDGNVVDWDDSAAQTRSILATFVVDEVLATAPEKSSVRTGWSLQVQIYVDAQLDADRVGEGLVASRESVVFLTSTPKSTGSEWAIAEEGSLIATVDENERLRLAGSGSSAGPDEDEPLKNDLATLADLRAAATVDRIVKVGV